MRRHPRTTREFVWDPRTETVGPFPIGGTRAIGKTISTITMSAIIQGAVLIGAVLTRSLPVSAPQILICLPLIVLSAVAAAPLGFLGRLLLPPGLAPPLGPGDSAGPAHVLGGAPDPLGAGGRPGLGGRQRLRTGSGRGDPHGVGRWRTRRGPHGHPPLLPQGEHRYPVPHAVRHPLAVGPVMAEENVHNRIAVLRADRRVSRRELAEALGVHYQTVGYLERGEYAPSLHLALRIARYFDVPVESVFSLEEFPRLR